jgi:Flp pilus assembly protein TadG
MDGELLQRVKEEHGLTAVIVALLMVVFIGVAAFAIDVGHLYLVKNELQNAADAGALAGARFLYDEYGEYVNGTSSQIAYDAAMVNRSENLPVEVHWSGGNTGDVERGHWSFSTRAFTSSDNDGYTQIWDVSPDELDSNPNFVNAIRVRTRRQDTPAVSFFARIFGYENFFLSTEAVAYIGFSGTLAPGEASQPIAICKESLLMNGQYTCSTGRMITNHEQVAGQESGGWTDFNQDSPCFTGTNAETVRSLICNAGNPDSIILGQPIAINGGYIQNAHGMLRQCWQILTGETQLWTLTLPVIECPGNNMDSCASVVGAVTVNIVWITPWEDDPSYSWAPWQMENPRTGTTWSSNDPDGQVRWTSFVQNFNLQNVDGNPVPYQRRGVYFLPDCNTHQPKGRTGGENFGIMAKIPVLAK